MSKRDFDVLNSLFAAGRPLTSSEIVDSRQGLTQSTALTILRKLAEQGLVAVTGVTHSGKVLSRQYTPTEKARESVEAFYLETFRATRYILPPDALIGLAERFRETE